MDDMLIVGCLILFFVAVVVPILAIVALNRSGSVRGELGALRRRLDELEQRGVPPVAVAPEPVIEAVAPPAAARVADTIVVKTPAPASSWEEENWHAEAAPSPIISVKPQKPSAFGGMLSSLVRWFMQGNPLAKLGILLLFLGISFLLRYTIDHTLLPLGVRVAAAALGSVALLVVGWRLRHRQPVYALILQGGATGALYLTVFGAFRLWQMLPMGLAFALLLLICAASVGLAVLQKALSLAMLASLGGYLAPLLLSTGDSNHVALFSFYLLLSAGILVISIWQHWRELNLLGLLFTFGVGGLWGMKEYRPEFYLSCQLFLLANVVLFGVLSVALALRAQERGKRIVDGVLLFAPPLVGFGMQYAITRDMTWGPALSALGYGGLYIVLAWLALRRFPSLGKMFILATLVLGGGFATLAIPLALSPRWTAMAWALEGLGILWLGMQQQQRRMSYSGTALLLLALGSAVWALMHQSAPLNIMMLFGVLSLCWLAAAWLWRGYKFPFGKLLLTGGILFWLMALLGASLLAVGKNNHAGFGVLGLLALSVWIWRFAACRLAWPGLGHAAWLLWPAMWLALWSQIAHGHIFSAGWENLAWCVALPSALLLLRRATGGLAARVSQALHLTLFWLLLLVVAAELWWFVFSSSFLFFWYTGPWRDGLIMTVGAAIIGLTYFAIRRAVWPFSVWPVQFGTLGVAPVVPVLVMLLLVANLHGGMAILWGHLPLLNPLEEGAGFALLALWSAGRFAAKALPAMAGKIRRWLPLVIVGLCFWWANGLLMRTLAWYGDVFWWRVNLWHSPLIQTSFALFWMLTALVVMLRATRRHARREWLGGAVLLGLVIVKLMLVDSAKGGGLARAIAFIGVAVLVLIIGYFSPLPPKEAAAESAGEKR